MNNYTLSKIDPTQKTKTWSALRTLLPLLKDEKRGLILASLAVFITSAVNLVAPVLIGRAVDHSIQGRNLHGLLVYGVVLLAMFVGGLVSQYFQTMLMGTVAQHLLFNLRNVIFEKIQSLPVAFFNQNKAGDLISRINNDTDKLNEFFARSFIQFIANIIMIIGSAIFIVIINWKLGLAALVPAALLLIFTQLASGWMKRKNALSLKTVGGMSAEISESLDTFKVIVAFSRRDYFRKKFAAVNEVNYESAIGAGIANNTLTPAYGFVSSLAQLVVIAYGIHLISTGDFTLGLLISFLTYIVRLYDPLRQMAAIWSSFQVALAGWDRIHRILSLSSDLGTVPSAEKKSASLVEFKQVSFHYPDGKEVLHNINFTLQAGKTYALVGPTGGGKTTTASLMARLYDPTQGTVLFNGVDIRSYTPEQRAQKVGFILQEPFLFTGTVRENIVYGNDGYAHLTFEQFEKTLTEAGLEKLLARFDAGLETKIDARGGTLSLGQKQLVAFMRAVLRSPELLILDEATANIDTITEQLLEEIIQKLPPTTTKVIIAHRLNTIENADEIFFVNAGEVTPAGSMEQAVDMLLHGKRTS